MRLSANAESLLCRLCGGKLLLLQRKLVAVYNVEGRYDNAAELTFTTGNKVVEGQIGVEIVFTDRRTYDLLVKFLSVNIEVD